MRRLSRAEAQEQTRARLLDAAEDAFAAEGFAGASLERIAAAAGLTRGAVYSNFSDKADLFVAVLDRRLERRRREIAAALEEAGDPASFLAAMRDPRWGASEASIRRQVLLADEFRLFALRHPPAARRLAEHDRLVRDAFVGATNHLLGQLGVAPPEDQRLVAAMLVALDQGLPRQRLIDPADVSPTAFADAVDLLLRAAVALGASSDQRPN